jgi:hypothetical protein
MISVARNNASCSLTRVQTTPPRVNGSALMRAKSVRKAQPRTVLLQAVDPNDPITWNMDEAEMEIMEMSPQETDFLSSSDISMLLSESPSYYVS